jgi:hypothetical protein
MRPPCAWARHGNAPHEAAADRKPDAGPKHGVLACPLRAG